jgi:hypothetical protein
MIMINEEVLQLNAIFEQLSTGGSTKFKFSVLKNIEKLNPTFPVLKKLEKEITEVIVDFEKDRNALIMELGVKRDDNMVYIDPADEETVKKFNERLQELVQTHKESIDKYTAQVEGFKELLRTEIENPIKFNVLNIEEFPEEGVSIEQLRLLTKCGIID